jgi:hypothetical protein
LHVAPVGTVPAGTAPMGRAPMGTEPCSPIGALTGTPPPPPAAFTVDVAAYAGCGAPSGSQAKSPSGPTGLPRPTGSGEPALDVRDPGGGTSAHTAPAASCHPLRRERDRRCRVYTEGRVHRQRPPRRVAPQGGRSGGGYTMSKQSCVRPRPRADCGLGQEGGAAGRSVGQQGGAGQRRDNEDDRVRGEQQRVRPPVLHRRGPNTKTI